MPADHVVVHVVASVAPAIAIEDLRDEDIELLYDAPVRAARDALRDGRANGATRFVFVIPSLAERGAAAHAVTCAAAEAVRVLALSAARQWSDDGVTVNCVAVESPDDDITALVEFLASGAVSGETIRAGGPRQGV